jgi:cytochrome c556
MSMNNRFAPAWGLVFIATAALAGCNKPKLDPATEAVMKERHEGFEKIGDNFKLVNDKLKAGGGLDEETAAAARTISVEATKIANWFPQGSGPETGAKTEAKADIWSNQDDFGKKREDFVTESARWAQLADAGDAAGFAAQAKTVGGTCKACHDSYRQKK